MISHKFYKYEVYPQCESVYGLLNDLSVKLILHNFHGSEVDLLCE